MQRRALAIADQLLSALDTCARTQFAVPQLTCLRQWPGRLEGCIFTPVHLSERCMLDIHTLAHGQQSRAAARSLTPSRGQQQRQQEQHGLSQALTVCLQKALHSHPGKARALPLQQHLQQQPREYSSSLAPAALQRLAGIKARHDDLCKQLSGEACLSSRACAPVCI